MLHLIAACAGEDWLPLFQLLLLPILYNHELEAVECPGQGIYTSVSCCLQSLFTQHMLSLTLGHGRL